MAKRFTGTEKWDDPWFCNLTPENKLLWIYLLDKCNHAGIIDFNLRMANFSIGHEGNKENILEVFKDRIVVLLSGKWFIKNFIDYQYKGILKPEVKAQKSVIDLLEKENIPIIINPNNSISLDKLSITKPFKKEKKHLPNPLKRVQDKDTDTEKNKDLNKKIEKEKDKIKDKKKVTECVHELATRKDWLVSIGANERVLNEFALICMGMGKHDFGVSDFKDQFTSWHQERHSK